MFNENIDPNLQVILKRNRYEELLKKEERLKEQKVVIYLQTEITNEHELIEKMRDTLSVNDYMNLKRCIYNNSHSVTTVALPTDIDKAIKCNSSIGIIKEYIESRANEIEHAKNKQKEAEESLQVWKQTYYYKSNAQTELHKIPKWIRWIFGAKQTDLMKSNLEE
jgi:hypothetical protein